MSCYKPLIRVENTTKWKRAEDGHLYHPAKIFSSDRLEEYTNRKTWLENNKYTIIPCGSCIGCRLDYSREWANRGYLESTLWNNNYFITLTYDEDNITIPEYKETKEGFIFFELEELEWCGTVVPKELQDFLKRLREYFSRKLNHKGIRFMACGEYGKESKRPHYHLILFNAPFPTESFYNPRINWEKNIYYQNKILEKCWPKGISNITECSWNTIAYVARYITKKINGKQSEELYAAQGQEKEFFRTSKNPGIAKDYYEIHKKEIYENDRILIKNAKGSHWIKPPKYFDNMYKKEFPEEFEEIKRKRKKEMINSLNIKSKKTSLTMWEQLQIEQATKELSSSTLKRPLD